MYNLLTELTSNGLLDVSGLLLALSEKDTAGVQKYCEAINTDLRVAIEKGRESAEAIFLDTFKSLYRTFRDGRDTAIQTDDVSGSQDFQAVCALIFAEIFPYERETLLNVFEVLLHEKYGMGDVGAAQWAAFGALTEELPNDYQILRYVICRVLLNREIRKAEFSPAKVREFTAALNSMGSQETAGLYLLNML